MDRIGVIGLGRMGSAIATRMSAEGREVRGWTRSGRDVGGVTRAADLKALVAGSDALILSLLNDDAVSAVLDALLALDLSGKLVIDTSTVSPAILKNRSGAFATKGASIVDAPIAGGPELVQAGSCAVFLGGNERAAARANACLSAISSRIFHVGPLGAGLVMKTINNGMLQIYAAGLAELLPMARRAGLPLETVLNIVSGGPAGLPMIRDRIPRILGQDDSVGFDAAAVFKDNAVFCRVVRSFGLPSPMLDRFADQRPAAEARGLMQRDMAALIRLAYESGTE